MIQTPKHPTRPQIGIGLMLVRGHQMLLGQRRSAHGAGEFGGPGGHMEHMESFESALLREVAEEAGPDLRIRNLRFLCVTNLTRYAPKHYVDIGMIGEWESGEPQVMEPHKLVSWGWYDIERPPTPLFGCSGNYVQAYRTGQYYFKD